MQLNTSSQLPEYFTGRLHRSLNQPLRLLHRSNSHFFILGATGYVYTVTLSDTPTCNCPDPTTPCKHILFLYIRVLSVPVDDPCLRQHTLRPYELTRLLSVKVPDKAFAGASIRQRFLELYGRQNGCKLSVTVEDGATRPACLEKMLVDGDRVMACATCKIPICQECLTTRRNIGYINLSAYGSKGVSSEVEGDDDDDEEEEEEEEEAEPGKHHRYIYRSVRLPVRVEALLEEVAQATRLQARRIERLEDLMQWHVQLEIERARAVGIQPPPMPPPRDAP